MDGVRPRRRRQPAPDDRGEPGGRGVQAQPARQARRAARARRGARLPARAPARLLRRGERTVRALQNACDNCRTPPATWDATEASRMALSCVYRFQQAGGPSFGVVHLIDVLRGKATDKVAQFGHERLSTFGIGAAVSEAQWRARAAPADRARPPADRKRVPDAGAHRELARRAARRGGAAAARGERGDVARQGRPRAARAAVRPSRRRGRSTPPGSTASPR